MREVLRDPKADLALRRTALSSLLGAGDEALPAILHELLDESLLRRDALRALAAYDDPRTPAVIFAVYSVLDVAGKRDALNTLASRRGYARALFDAISRKAVDA